MKYLWMSSVFMAGLILSGGTAFAASGNILSDRAENLSEGHLLMADASLDLDITMEVVDEDVQSSKDITNVIELPLRSRYREMERHQEQLGNRPAEGQGHGPNPFLEGNPESRQQNNRPSDIDRSKSVSSGGGAGNRGDITGGAGNRGDVTGGAVKRGDATGGPADSGTRSGGQSQKGETNKKGK